jgi:hypothetical protein
MLRLDPVVLTSFHRLQEHHAKPNLAASITPGKAQLFTSGLILCNLAL